MKKGLLFLVCCLGMVVGRAQSPQWLWAKEGRSDANGFQEGTSVAVDGSGNVYFTGSFNETISFNPDSPFVYGHNDVFVVKYTPDGNLLWSRLVGGMYGIDIGECLSTDYENNLYVLGYSDGSPSVIFGTDTLTGSGNFLAKYDSSGNVIWANKLGVGCALNSNLATDSRGNAYVALCFYDTAIFGLDTLIGNGYADVVIAKYDTHGNVLWAKSFGGNNYDYVYGISIDAKDKVYVTGSFTSDNIVFGSDTLTNDTTYSASMDIFLAKYDALGNFIWAKKAGGSGKNEAVCVANDRFGNVFITGFAGQNSIFGSDTLNEGGVFLAKYDLDGNVLWAKNTLAHFFNHFGSVATDASGNAYVVGGFGDSSVTFNSVTVTQPPNSTDAMFIYKFDSTGNVLCADALASGGDDLVDVAADAFGNAYVGSDFAQYLFQVGNFYLNRSGPESAFIAKFTCDAIQNVNNQQENKFFSLSPNPATNQLNISIDESLVGAQLNIYNVTGALVQTVLLSTANSQLSTGNLPNGVYIAEVKTKEARVMRRWVKM